MLILRALRASIFFALLAIGASSASATALIKTQFEQDTGILVWKTTEPNKALSSSDDFTDVSRPCDLYEGLDSKDVQKLYSSRVQDMRRSKDAAANIMNALGIRAEKLRMTFVQAYSGSEHEPVFLLFPEVHLKKENGDLHESRAWDLFHLTGILDSKNIKVLNTDEGPQGVWGNEPVFVAESFAQREHEVRRLLAKNYVASSQLVSKVYGDKVESIYTDSNDLIVKNLLAITAHDFKVNRVSPEVSWLKTLGYMRSNFPTRSRFVKLEDYKEFYESAYLLPVEGIKQLSNQLCEERSVEMARFTLEYAKTKQAKVVYMSFGANHTHGIMRYLEKNNASYIVFSPSR